MRMMSWMIAALMAVMLGAAALATLPSMPTVYVMRHLNTPEGERDPNLTDTGKASAQALVHWFHGKPVGAIYVSDYKRTRQTAEPLATERGIMLKLYDPRDTPALVARIKAETVPVLIVGHSNTVPDIVEALGDARPEPLGHHDFGDIWTVADGTTGRARLP